MSLSAEYCFALECFFICKRYVDKDSFSQSLLLQFCLGVQQKKLQTLATIQRNISSKFN